MEKVRIQTSQNVEIDFQLAGLGDRILAALLDYLVLVGYVFSVVMFLSLLGAFRNAGEEGGVVYTLLVFLPYLFYDLAFEVFYDGQTIGKQIMKIKVARLDGTQPGIGDYLLRWILRPIDVTILAGTVAIVTILANGKGQRLGDLAAGTTVVRLKAATDLSETMLADVGADYSPVFRQVTLLSEKDIRTATRVLNREVEDGLMAEHVAFRMKGALEKKMGVKSELSGRTFLETVVRDYNFYHLKGLQ